MKKGTAKRTAKTTTKRCLLLISAVTLTVMLFVCLAVVAYAGVTDGKAARIGVNCYDTLPEAVAAATDGQTVKLLSDVTLSETLAFDKSMRIDLNGKRLTGPGTGRDYMFSLTESGIEVSIIGEGTLYVYGNYDGNTYNGMVNIALGLAQSPTFNIAGSFDGITLVGEGCSYIAATTGNINVSNVKAYTPKDEVGMPKVMGLFNSRVNVNITLDRLVVYRTDGPGSNVVPSNYENVFHVYDSATTKITNSYIESSKIGMTVRHDAGANSAAAEGRRYLTVENCTVKATYARCTPEEGWGALYADDAKTEQIGWELNGAKGFAVVCKIISSPDSVPVGEASFDKCTLIGAWRVFVQDGLTVPVEELKHNVSVTNSELKSDVSECGVKLTDSLITELTNARKELDGEQLASTYTYKTQGKDNYVIPSEIAIVRGRGAKFYFDNCDMYGYSGVSYLWVSDDKNTEDEASDAYDYFLLEDNVRFNRAPAKACNFTSVQYGSQDNYIVDPIYDDDVYRYGIVNAYDGMWGTNDNSVETHLNYKYYDGTTESQSSYDEIQSKSPIKRSFTSAEKSVDGSNYMMLAVEKPSGNTYYTTSGNPGYSDADTMKLGVDAYFLVYGKSANSGTERNERITLYDDDGKARFKYVALEIYFKTDSSFISSNTSFTFRAVDGEGKYIENTAAMYFYEKSGVCYLMTSAQKTAGVTDVSKFYKLDKAAGEWYRYTCVIELADSIGTKGGAAHSNAYIFIDGENIATQSNVLSAGTAAINGFRFDLKSTSLLDVGETICFDSYRVRTSNQAYLNFVNIKDISYVERASTLEEITVSNIGGALKYFSENGEGNVSLTEENEETKKLSALKLSDEGSYIKFEIQNPIDSNTSYGNLHSADGKTVKIPSELDSHLLIRGEDNNGITQGLNLYNDAGTVPVYDKLIFEVDIKTDTAFIKNGSYLTLRLVNSSGNVVSGRLGLYFVRDTDEQYGTVNTYLRTYNQYYDRDATHPNGQGGLAIVENSTWQNITIVLTFNGDYKNAYADYYVAGKYVGRQNKYVDANGNSYNLLNSVPYEYDALRFNVQVDKTYGIGDNICFRNYKMYSYSKAESNLDDIIKNYSSVERTSPLDEISTEPTPDYLNVDAYLRYFRKDEESGAAVGETVVKNEVPNQTLSAVKLSDCGDYIKLGIQNTSWEDKNEDYGNPYADGDKITIPSELDSWLLMRGTYGDNLTGKLRLYDANGTVPVYDKLIFEFDIKTDSTFIKNGSYLAVRFVDSNNELITNYVSLRFTSDTDGKTYLRTHAQYYNRDATHPNGQGGLAIAENSEWHTVTVELTFNGSYTNAYANFYLSGQYVGRQDNLFEQIPYEYDALRFNVVGDNVYGLGDNICFRNYTLYSYSKAQLNLVNMKDYSSVERTSPLDEISTEPTPDFLNVDGYLRYFSALEIPAYVTIGKPEEEKMSAVKLSDGGDYIKLEIQDPIDSDTSYGNLHSADGKTVKIPPGINSWLLMRGTYGDNLTGSLKLYNANGTAPVYDKLIFEVDIKTDTAFIKNGPYLSLRLLNASGAVIDNSVSLYFVTGTDGRTYLRTPEQYGNKQGGLAIAESSEWQTITVELTLSGDYKNAFADFYISGQLVGRQNNLFGDVPYEYDALRFNIASNITYGIGDNICFRNYNMYSYSKGHNYYGSFVDPEKTFDDSSYGVYANYITPYEGQELYGEYYKNVTEALAANADKYPLMNLKKAESGTKVTSPAKIKLTGSATFENYEVAPTLGYIDTAKDYQVLAFSDTYHSVIGLNELKVYGGEYVSCPTELLWNQPIADQLEAQWGAQWKNECIPSSTDDTLYAPVGWNNQPNQTAGNVTLGPIGECELYAAYEKVVYIVWKNGTDVTKYSVDQTQFAADFNSLNNGGKIQLREDVTYEGKESMPIVGKTLTIDLRGERLAINRPAADEDIKRIFYFANTSAAEASTLNIVSTEIDGGEIFAGISGSTSAGAIFYVGDGPQSAGNTVNIGEGNVGLFSSCIFDSYGSNSTFNAKNGGRFFKTGSDYSGLFVIRSDAEDCSINIDKADIGTVYDEKSLFNILSESGEAKLNNCVLLSLANCAYLVNPGFMGTVSLSGVRSNIVLACREGTSSGRIELNGNNYTSAVSLDSTGVKTAYFINNENITYNGKSFADAKFGRVNEYIKTSSGDNVVTLVYNSTAANLLSQSYALSDVLEVVTLGESESSVKWINYDGKTSIAPARNDNDNIESGNGSPFSVEAVNLEHSIESVYYFVWKITGTEQAEALSLTEPIYPITIDPIITVCEMKTKSDFKLMSNLSLTDNFSYNIYVPASLITNGGNITYTANSNTYSPDLSKSYVINGTTYYRIEIKDISVFNANEEISFTMSIPVLAENAIQKTHNPKWTYSVTKYAVKVLNNVNDHTTAKQMVTDMLAYVSAAYLFDGSETPTEVSDALTLAEWYGYTPTEYAPAAAAKTPDGIGDYITGVTVNIAVPETRFRFTFAEGLSAMVRLSYLSAKGNYNESFIKVEGGIVTQINGVNTSDGLNYFELETKVYDFNADIVLAVDGDGDGMTYNTEKDHITEFNSVSYVSYVQSLYESETDAAKKAAAEKTLNLVKTLYCYSESARKYQEYIMSNS